MSRPTSTDESEDGLQAKDQIESSSTEEGGNSWENTNAVVLKKGPWTTAEDAILVEYVRKHGEGNWNAVQKQSGLCRCGKSCRLRWANHLRPNLKKGAFTLEEEQLIIELHAKMGNKWARMAAHLPGRTDNEIKNYWNTRIKRRQRAGLPLYPPDVAVQSLPENHQYPEMSGMMSSGDANHPEQLKMDFEIPDIIFPGLKHHQVSYPVVPEASELTRTSMLMEGLGSVESSFYRRCILPYRPSPPRRIWESSMSPRCNSTVRNEFSLLAQCHDVANQHAALPSNVGLPFFSYPERNPPSFSAMQGSHALPNGTFLTSDPISGNVKLELPSLQYTEPDLGSWVASNCGMPLLDSFEAYMQFPAAETAGQSFPPELNSGLLNAIIEQANVVCNSNNCSSRMSSNSSTIITHGDVPESSLNSVSPFCYTPTSIFNECTRTGNASHLDELPIRVPPGNNLRPVFVAGGEQRQASATTAAAAAAAAAATGADALMESSWMEHIGSNNNHDDDLMSDAIAMLLGEEFATGYKQRPAGFPKLDDGWASDYFGWKNISSSSSRFSISEFL